MTVASERSPIRGRPPQFRLRTLMFVTAGFAALFAVATAVSTATLVVLIWFLGLAVLHVDAAAVGHWQRDRTSRELRQRRIDGGQVPVALELPPRPASHGLRQNEPVGFIVLATAFCGAAGGLLVGTMALVGIGRISPAALALGAASSGVVGAFLGFLLGSFLAIARRAWHEATQEARMEITIEARSPLR